MNYHSCKDRKRYGDNYSRQLCQYADNPDNCPDGDDCLNAHSRV